MLSFLICKVEEYLIQTVFITFFKKIHVNYFVYSVTQALSTKKKVTSKTILVLVWIK